MMGNAAAADDRPYEVVCSSDDHQWLGLRCRGIGASEIAAVLGIDPRQSPLGLYAEKIGAVERRDLSDVEAVKWGRILEPVIAQVFAETTGRRIERGGLLLRSREHPWALATLDYWTTDGESPEMWPLEIKNVTAYKAEDWEDGAPDYYLAQIHQQMLVTGSRKATAACLLGGNRLLWCDVTRDETMIRKIRYHGELFWERVLQRRPPDPDASDATRRVLHSLFSVDDGSVVELPMALTEIVEEWRALKAEDAKRRKQIQALENVIKATLGSAKCGLLPTGDQISWATEHVREHVVRAHDKRVLRYHPRKKGR